MSSKLMKTQRGAVGTGPVKYVTDPNHPNALGLAVDYENAPVPPHFYVADFCRLTELGMNVLLEFGKRMGPTSETLRSKVEIYFPTAMFISQLWATSRNFHAVLAKTVGDAGFKADEPLTTVIDTDKVQTVHSNNVLAVMSGGECMMDFFYISPKELWTKPPKQGNIEIEALVRIICAPTLALAFFDACAPIAEQMKGRFKDWIGEPDVVESK